MASLERLDIENGTAAGVAVSNVPTGVTVRTFDADASVDVDTVAGATLTFDSQIDLSSGITVTDAATVNLGTTATAASKSNFNAVALDDAALQLWLSPVV